MRKGLIIFLLTFFCGTIYAQSFDAFGNRIPSKEKAQQQPKSGENKVDAQGRKQGSWKKYYPNGNIRYEVTFKDNKPVGELKRYFENGNPSVIIQYNETGTFGEAQLFNEEDQLIAKGFYDGQLRDSLWTFFARDKKVATESYLAGKKNGKTLIYFTSGQIAEEINWVNDVKNGPWEQLYESGRLKTRSQHVNGKLEGEYRFYFENGEPEIEGQYKNDKEEGTWIFYNENGSVKYTLHFVEGMVQNPEAMDQVLNNRLKEYEESRHNLKDPELYKHDPDGYIRGR
jgi:antitoxin component YwqK of YwqJK toxin-antitoxin module